MRPSHLILLDVEGVSNIDSCLMQDEPEGGYGFSRKVSLRRRGWMLGIDHQHERHGSKKPESDRGVSDG